jgi:nitrate reductase gamma subunit
MDGLSFLVGGILPYIAVLVFVGGMAWRVRTWARAKQPGKMTLFPAPHGASFRAVMAESLLFPRLFRGDRVLWFISWFFHVTLLLVFLGHIRVVTGVLDAGLRAVGVSEGGIDWMSSNLGGAAGVILLLTAVLLLVRRIAMARVREVSGFADFFALILLAAVVLSGDVMRFSGHFDLEATRAWATSLVTLSPDVSSVNGAFLTHLLLAQLLIIYIPCSKILHMGGIFFTQTLVLRR